MREVFLDEVGGQHDVLTHPGDLLGVEWETAICFQPGPGLSGLSPAFKSHSHPQ